MQLGGAREGVRSIAAAAQLAQFVGQGVCFPVQVHDRLQVVLPLAACSALALEPGAEGGIDGGISGSISRSPAQEGFDRGQPGAVFDTGETAAADPRG